MLNKNTLLKINRIALKIDHDVAFGGKSKGNQHLWRVVRVAKYIAKQLGADVSIVEAGAWLHDTALPSETDYRYKKNKEIVKNILTNLNLSKKELDKIAECVASHEGTAKPKTLEAQIVHDADVLEKSGILGIIRHTWKLTNLCKIVPGNVTKKDAAKILIHLKWRSKKIKTSLGKKIHSYLAVPITITKAEELISIVAGKAIRGIITEKIARSLYKKLNGAQQRKLKEQLSLAYLRRF